MTPAQQPTQPERGDVRFNAAGEVEFFDGTDWQPYRELPDDPDDSGYGIFRGPDTP